jgi:pyridine nucleotide-disulfide oxidoreductase family protein
VVIASSQRMTRILLIGGGHTHVVALRHLARHKPAGLDIDLVSPDLTTSYSGLLPGHIAGHWTRHILEIPLLPLCRTAGATLHSTRATSLDPVAQTVGLASGDTLSFDYASLDIGAIADIAGPENLRKVGVPVKPLGPFADRWSAFIAGVETGKRPPHAAVLGAGTAGVELALSMKYRLDRLGLSRPVRVSLIERGADLLPGGTKAMRRHLERELKRASIAILTGDSVVDADENGLRLTSHEDVPAGFVALATGARPQAWLAGTGLTLHDGFVSVSRTLQSVSHPRVFACGDTAHLTFDPRPKAGVFAVRQGAVLAEQFVRLAANQPLAHYHPQKDYLKLVSLGRRRAIAEKWGITLNLPGLWALKRHIDLKFMENS